MEKNAMHSFTHTTFTYMHASITFAHYIHYTWGKGSNTTLNIILHKYLVLV